MATLEERLASLEARMDAMTELRALLLDVRNDMNRQFAQVDADVSELRADLNRQMTELRGDISRRIDTLDNRHDRHFTWLVGLQLTLMIAVIAALLGR